MNLVGEDGIIIEDMLPVDILNYYKNNKLKESKNENYSDMCINIEEQIDLNNGKILSLKDLELIYINKLLDRYGRDTKTKKDIAKNLGIGLATLYRKLEEG